MSSTRKMYVQMGNAGLSALDGYFSSSHRSKMARISRQHQEAMNTISFMMQSDTQTRNEVSTADALVRTQEALQAQALRDAGSARVSAAAAGVSGGSVANTMRGLVRSRLLAQRALKERSDAQHRANTHARRQLAVSHVTNKDISPIPKASAASALLGLGGKLVDIYDSHQPEGSKLSDIKLF